jgi:hypothetical protein
MTGNTPTVLLGLAVIALTLPIGLLILYLANRGIERAHPGNVDRRAGLPQREASAQVPGPRPASRHEGLDEKVEPRAGRQASSV